MRDIGLEQAGAIKLHDSIEALTASKDSCRLCNLIHAKIQRYLTATESVESAVWIGLPSYLGEDAMRIALLDHGLSVFITPEWTKESRKCVIVTLLAVCVEPTDPLSCIFRGRPRDPFGGSERVLNWIVQRMQDCANTHSQCPQGQTTLPSRILEFEDDAGSSDALGIIKLRETNGESGSYAALSYCWGSTNKVQTTRSNMDDMMAGIPVSSLPKTMQDAIILTKRLGLNKLWIDALCICQYDEEDWAKESANMRSVYAQAFITIAACGATDSEGGCFSCRQNTDYVDIPYTSNSGITGQLFVTSEDIPMYTDRLALKSEPLSSRAWAFQERVLSRRTALFCSQQVYFECLGGTLAEDGSTFDRKHLSKIYEDLAARPQFLTDHWFSLVQDFTKRQLTRQTDRLPAFSALAQNFHTHFGGQYLAGLWSTDLIRSLEWRISSPVGDPFIAYSNQDIAPSWSWATCSCPVQVFSRPRAFLAAAIDYGTRLKTSNPYGEVVDGWITLRAPLFPLATQTEQRTVKSQQVIDHYVRVSVPDVTVRSPVRLRHWDAQSRTYTDMDPDEFQLSALLLAMRDYNTPHGQDPKYECSALIIGKPSQDPAAKLRRLSRVTLLVPMAVIEDRQYLNTVTLH